MSGNQSRPTHRPTDRLNDSPTPTSEPASLPTTTVGLPLESRPTAGRIMAMRARLGERDLRVLTLLGRLRLLTGDQLRRLVVVDGSPTTQARRTRAMLQRLSELRLVVRLGRQVGGVRAGSSGYVYGLSGHGQAVLAIDGPMGGPV